MPSSGKIRKNISHFWCKILEAEFFLKKACSSWEMVCQSLWETMWGVLLLPCLLKTLFSKKKSALVLRLLFQDFEKKIRITFSHVRKVRGKSLWELPNCPLFSHYFFCRRTFPIVQSPLKGWQNNRWQTWLTNATRTLPFIIPSTTMRSFGLRVFYSSWSAL